MSSTTRSAKNLPLDIVKDIEVDGNSDGNNNETVKKITFKEVKPI